ncbi:MAG: hypothetical protein R3313_04230 [Candidatus Saccharimonadales bacterium]|nr:hypothetical protein [Candidatus Saccharimonadales bacterium]
MTESTSSASEPRGCGVEIYDSFGWREGDDFCYNFGLVCTREGCDLDFIAADVRFPVSSEEDEESRKKAARSAMAVSALSECAVASAIDSQLMLDIQADDRTPQSGRQAVGLRITEQSFEFPRVDRKPI